MSVFIETRETSQVFETKHFWVRRDGFAVSPGHSLIISKRLAENYFELTEEEKQDLILAIDITKDDLDAQYNPDGYNIGMNCGVASGQTVMHFHCHLIPRYNGDCENPRGGVRHCVPGKGYY
jgi:diadenosine tetraphosphate (Ap4A) HIT family hydrolase